MFKAYYLILIFILDTGSVDKPADLEMHQVGPFLNEEECIIAGDSLLREFIEKYHYTEESGGFYECIQGVK